MIFYSLPELLQSYWLEIAPFHSSNRSSCKPAHLLPDKLNCNAPRPKSSRKWLHKPQTNVTSRDIWKILTGDLNCEVWNMKIFFRLNAYRLIPKYENWKEVKNLPRLDFWACGIISMEQVSLNEVITNTLTPYCKHSGQIGKSAKVVWCHEEKKGGRKIQLLLPMKRTSAEHVTLVHTIEYS